MDGGDEVEAFYDGNARHKWERLDRQRTEFAVTMRALREHLPPPPTRILDVGGGPGRYAIALTGLGYEVTLVDPAGQMLEYARSRAEEAGVHLAGYVHANAGDLAQIPSATFDVMLLMGPLYHLLRRRDRRRAVTEAARVLEVGGLAAVSFVTRYAPIRWSAKNEPAWIARHAGRVENILVTGMNIAESSSASTGTYFTHPSEIRPLMTYGGFEMVDLVATEGVVSMIDEKLNEVSGDLWERWVEVNYLLGKDPTVYGAAEHLLYIGRKREKLPRERSTPER